MNKVAYKQSKHSINVFLEGKKVGCIKLIPNHGFTYYPKGSKQHGEVFDTISDVKASLEQED